MYLSKLGNLISGRGYHKLALIEIFRFFYQLIAQLWASQLIFSPFLRLNFKLQTKWKKKCRRHWIFLGAYKLTLYCCLRVVCCNTQYKSSFSFLFFDPLKRTAIFRSLLRPLADKSKRSNYSDLIVAGHGRCRKCVIWTAANYYFMHKITEKNGQIKCEIQA